MPIGNVIELVAAALLIAAGIYLYRRRGREDPRQGSHAAVILMMIGAIVAVHGLGLLAYRPMEGEL